MPKGKKMTLKELRLSKGLNLKQASTISKVSIYHIKRLECGQWKGAYVHNVLRLMRLLEVEYLEFEAAVNESARIQTEVRA